MTETRSPKRGMSGKWVALFLLLGVGAWTIAIYALATNTEADATAFERKMQVSNAWARAATAGDDTQGMVMNETPAPEGMAGMHAAGTSAVYLTIKNTTDEVERLVEVQTEVAEEAQLHETRIGEGDVAQMVELTDGIEIIPGQSVELKPGGKHIMLLNLTRDLVAGETISLTLRFESGREVHIEAEVRAE